jgi:glycerophosphoryl diester phosphodiesterase/endonuclease/exonuclease/phosphatase family metal-dependent hydrolase
MILSLMGLGSCILLAMSDPAGTEIVAHRGASFDAPENTVASVRLAWEQKADASEFDVYLSKDGKIVVLHDRDLKRTAGVDRAVTDMTAEELKALDVGRWKGEKYAGEPVPTLDDVLATVPDGKRVFIEVKCGPEIAEELRRVLEASPLKPEQTAIISFSPEVVAAAKKALPDRKAYWVVSLGRKDDEKPPTADELVARAKEIHADGLDLSARAEILTPEYARTIKSQGLELYVWTVNDPALARAMIAAGVDGITTDRPGWLREQLADQGDASCDVRVMSFNIRYGTAADGENAWPRRKEFLFETIAAFDPDLLGTQETLAGQRDDLAGRLSGYETLAAGRDDGQERGEMMALFYRKSRFEKLAGGHFWLSETPDVPGSKSWDSSLPRMVTWVKLRDRMAPGAKPIAYFNTHFDHRGPKARLESARLLRRKVDELAQDCRVIVTGDFNSPEGGEPYQALFGRGGSDSRPLVDSFRAAHPSKEDAEGTFSGFRAGAIRGARIDWIGCSPDLDVRDAAIDRTARDGRTPSDHFPVTAVLRPS